MPLAEGVCANAGARDLGRQGTGQHVLRFPVLHASLSPVVFQVVKLILAPQAARAAFPLLRSICPRREASGPLSHASRHCPRICIVKMLYTDDLPELCVSVEPLRLLSVHILLLFSE